jgi:hypothetical protein
MADPVSSKDPMEMALFQVRQAITASFNPSDADTLQVLAKAHAAENAASSAIEMLAHALNRFSAALVYVHAILEAWARESGVEPIELWRKVLVQIDAEQ